MSWLSPSTRAVPLIAALLLAASGCSSTSDNTYELRTDFAQYFDAEQVAGTIVLLPVDSDEIPLVHDIQRARRDYPPAQTFKILTTLIALEVSAVDSVDTEIVWDGNGALVPPWDRVHSLRSSMQQSGYWFVDAVVDEVGFAPVEVWVNRADYGNGNIRGSLHRFWLDGTLVIDAMQQAEFMALIFSENHPFDHYAALDAKDLLPTAEGDNWSLRYLTANTTGEEPIRWLVGVVTTDEGKWAIAMNIENPIGTTIDLDQPLRITQTVLMGADIIPAP